MCHGRHGGLRLACWLTLFEVFSQCQCEGLCLRVPWLLFTCSSYSVRPHSHASFSDFFPPFLFIAEVFVRSCLQITKTFLAVQPAQAKVEGQAPNNSTVCIVTFCNSAFIYFCSYFSKEDLRAQRVLHCVILVDQALRVRFFHTHALWQCSFKKGRARSDDCFASVREEGVRTAGKKNVATTIMPNTEN